MSQDAQGRQVAGAEQALPHLQNQQDPSQSRAFKHLHMTPQAEIGDSYLYKL